MTEFNTTILEKKLRKGNDTSLLDTYRQVHTAFVDNVLDEITQLSNSVDNSMLTDHGPKHIRMVINKASMIIKEASIEIDRYEVYLLLVAIMVHDIGNATGRAGHEKKINDIWQLVFGRLGFDELDKHIAFEIASVHGGKIAGSKDTISTLEHSLKWKNATVRPRFLAAILRLADEMAEDRHRSNKLGVMLNNIKKSAEAYHYYAYALHSFVVDVNASELSISLAAVSSYFEKRIGKDDRETTLLEEIFSRTLKSFYEAIYCSRFLEGKIIINKVRVKIDILGSSATNKVHQIQYVIKEHGHPAGDNLRSIYELAPELKNYNGSGQQLDDTLLTDIIRRHHAL